MELYKSLYDGVLDRSPEDGGPTERQKRSRLEMIEGAERVLERARQDAAKEAEVATTDQQ